MDQWLYFTQNKPVGSNSWSRRPIQKVYCSCDGWKKDPPLIDSTRCINTQQTHSSLDDHFEGKVFRAYNAAHWPLPIVNMVPLFYGHVLFKQVYDCSPYLPFCTRIRFHDGNLWARKQTNSYHKRNDDEFGCLFTVVPFVGDEAFPYNSSKLASLLSRLKDTKIRILWLDIQTWCKDTRTIIRRNGKI